MWVGGIAGVMWSVVGDEHMKRILRILTMILGIAGIPYAIYAAIYLLMNPEGTPADKRDVEPSVSIVLPTYN